MSFNIVEIKKIKFDKIHYYSVGYPFNPILFYIGIDPAKRIVYYFLNANFNNSIGAINLANEDCIIPIENVDRFAFFKSALQAYKTLQTNDFSEDISWSP